MSTTTITVGMSSCGIAAGARSVYDAIREYIRSHEIDAELGITGCIGMCHAEVLVEVDRDGKRTLYREVTPEKAERILEEHVAGGSVIEEWAVAPGKESFFKDPYFKKQVRIVLRNCGDIDPEDMDDYLARDGYKALEKALKGMSPEEVIEQVKASGLRGRGGAGFPTGLKWSFARAAKSDKKYVVCNADEGDPGAFMDRSVLEGDPHAVLEGMAIAAYAIGADEGYIYCRAEYPLAIKRLYKAISEAKERGYLGKNVLGTGFDFEVHVKEGAGAFVCGEETALMASIEGKRGMPRIRPPFPANKGLWGKSTNINNVETYANVPWIILNGADAYAAYGTEKSKGTKVFALAGKIKRGGLIEVPMGTTLREIIYDIGGGIKEDREFKAVQMGGPSGGCIPADYLDTPIDYEKITATGAIMGSGGMIVLDETSCMVDLARYFLTFTQQESCGKCTFCRVGTKRMLEILTRICEGKGREGDVELLEELALNIKKASLCGLGQTAPNPVLTTIRYFRHEYDAHIKEKRCPALKCKSLIRFEIVEDACVGCTICARKCPVGAISGEVKKPHVIHQEKCVKCGICEEKCPKNAIRRVSPA